MADEALSRPEFLTLYLVEDFKNRLQNGFDDSRTRAYWFHRFSLNIHRPGMAYLLMTIANLCYKEMEVKKKQKLYTILGF